MFNYKLIFLYCVETFFMLYIGISIFNLKIDKRRMISIMMIYGMSIYGIRNIYQALHIPLGTHTIILLILFCLYSIFIYKMSVVQAISTAYIAYTLETIGEWTITMFIVDKYQLMVDSRFFESWKGICIGATAYTFLIGLSIAFAIYRRWIVVKGSKYKRVAIEKYVE